MRLSLIFPVAVLCGTAVAQFPANEYGLPGQGPALGPSQGPARGPAPGAALGPAFGPAPSPAQGPAFGPAPIPAQGPAFGPAFGPAPSPAHGPAQGPTSGGDILPTSILPENTPGLLPAPAPLSEGGDIMPALILPENTRASLVDDRGQYSHGFSDKEGTQVSEQGSLFSTNEGWEYVIKKVGFYAYKSPEGKMIRVNYIADHNGFHVLGDSQF